MHGKFWDELKVGDRFVTPGRTITESVLTVIGGIAGIAEPLFMDEEFARKTHFGGRILPGALTLLMMQGPWQQLGVLSDTGMGLLGFDKVTFPAPVRLGDTIHVEVELVEKRETSKPDRGLLRWHWLCKDQKDEVKVELESANLARRKGS